MARPRSVRLTPFQLEAVARCLAEALLGDGLASRRFRALLSAYDRDALEGVLSAVNNARPSGLKARLAGLTGLTRPTPNRGSGDPQDEGEEP